MPYCITVCGVVPIVVLVACVGVCLGHARVWCGVRHACVRWNVLQTHLAWSLVAFCEVNS